VGVQLVCRTTRRIEPTEIGQTLYRHGRAIRDELAAYRDDVRHEVTLSPTLASENFQFLREAILSGLGIGLVPSYVVEEGVKAGLVVTALTFWRLSIFGTRLFLLRMPDRYQTQAVRTFIDFIVEKAAQWSRQQDSAMSET
jgi:DNA-binding transcriptional LysR family regulator